MGWTKKMMRVKEKWKERGVVQIRYIKVFFCNFVYIGVKMIILKNKIIKNNMAIYLSNIMSKYFSIKKVKIE